MKDNWSVKSAGTFPKEKSLKWKLSNETPQAASILRQAPNSAAKGTRFLIKICLPWRQVIIKESVGWVELLKHSWKINFTLSSAVRRKTVLFGVVLTSFRKPLKDRQLFCSCTQHAQMEWVGDLWSHNFRRLGKGTCICVVCSRKVAQKTTHTQKHCWSEPTSTASSLFLSKFKTSCHLKRKYQASRTKTTVKN